MKKFIFSLDKVLSYKEEVQEGIQQEYAVLVKRVQRQEDKVRDLETEYQALSAKLEKEKRSGCNIMNIRMYEAYFTSLDGRIKEGKQILVGLQRIAEKKRQELVDAKVETSAIQKLKEKKLKDYEQEMQKKEEQSIEEFISNSTISAR